MMQEFRITILALLTIPFTVAAISAERPNIVLIMSDDMGYSDIGCYGGEIETPNLNRLAANGLRFTQFYNTGRCCPTRASLLTGLYPHQTGIGHKVNDIGTRPYVGHLHDGCVTIAEVLKEAGYDTWMSGKWHVGERRPHWPRDRGFDRFFGLINGYTNFFELDPHQTMAVDNQSIRPEPGSFYLTDSFTDHAISFLNEHQNPDQPFFLYLPYTAPHWPLHALPEDIAKYDNRYDSGWKVLRDERLARMRELGVIDTSWELSVPDDDVPEWDAVTNKQDLSLRMAVYAAQLDRMDQGIGQILEKLNEQRRFDNTLVFFLADNGGCHEIISGTWSKPTSDEQRRNQAAGTQSSYLSYGRGWANASNTPFRMYKHWTHEGGIASPLIVHWPAGLTVRGTITHEISHVIDIMATAVDVAGAKYPSKYQGKPITPLEGKSLSPLFRGETRKGHEALYWEHEGNRAVRRGDWKLVSPFETEEWELYNLKSDRSEIHNLIDKKPEIANSLQTLFESKAREWGIRPWPELKASYAASRNAERSDFRNRPYLGPPQFVARGAYPDLIFDRNGQAHLVYVAGGTLRYRVRDADSQQWSDELDTGIDQGLVQRSDPEVTVDTGGRVHVLVGSTYARLENGQWKRISDAFKRDTDLALNSAGNAYVVRRGGTGDGYLGLLRLEPDGKAFQPLPDPDIAAGFPLGRNDHVYGSIAVSPLDDSIHIVYRHGSPRNISYRVSTDGGKTWQGGGVTDREPEAPDIAISRDGQVYVANADGQVFRRNGSPEEWTALGSAFEGGRRELPQIHVSDSGEVHVAAFGGKYNRFANDSWDGTRTLPARTGYSLGYADFASDPSGDVWIVYEEGPEVHGEEQSGESDILLLRLAIPSQ